MKTNFTRTAAHLSSLWLMSIYLRHSQSVVMTVSDCHPLSYYYYTLVTDRSHEGRHIIVIRNPGGQPCEPRACFGSLSVIRHAIGLMILIISYFSSLSLSPSVAIAITFISFYMQKSVHSNST